MAYPPTTRRLILPNDMPQHLFVSFQNAKKEIWKRKFGGLPPAGWLRTITHAILHNIIHGMTKFLKQIEDIMESIRSGDPEFQFNRGLSAISFRSIPEQSEMNAPGKI
jgi:hypothetical protein